MAQPSLWRLAVGATRSSVDAVETALAALGFRVAARSDADGASWIVEGYAPGFDAQAIAARLARAQPDGPPLAYTLERVPPRDWVAESQRSFAPVAIGRYLVHASHDRAARRSGRMALEIDPATAFGSGRHGSTAGCLAALDGLARRRRFARPLDLGSGSGILALAIALTWRVPVLAVDVDPEAVRVTAENARRNRLRGLVRARRADGPGTRGSFDLVVANILSRPLRRLARPIARRLVTSGIAVLSGFAETDESFVLVPYRDLGLRLLRRYTLDGWRTLVLAR